MSSCDTCLSLPSCGWCDSGNGTGLGDCMEGSGRGPLYFNSSGAFVDKKACSAKHWNFTTCPGKDAEMRRYREKRSNQFNLKCIEMEEE